MTGVQTHAYVWTRLGLAPVVIGEGTLAFRARGDRAGGVRKGREDGVAFGEQRAAAEGFKDVQQNPAMLDEHHPIVSTQRAGQAGRALDVSEQKRH